MNLQLNENLFFGKKNILMKSIQTMTFYFLIKICFKNDFFFVVVVVLTDVIHSCIHLFIYF